jgi:hypothetical protein
MQFAFAVTDRHTDLQASVRILASSHQLSIDLDQRAEEIAM